jgi:uncharacterized membrane protein (Fun14 family)
MSDQHDKPGGSGPPPRPHVPVWGKLLAILSVVLMGAGVAIPFAVGGDPSPPTATEKSAAPGAAGLTESGSSAVTPAQAEADRKATWGPWVFRLGFSFFVGFAIAFALRSFMKFAIVALGFFFLALFGLQYAGILEVRWSLLAERYDELSGQISARAAGAWKSMSTLLPSAASATAGLVAGFWRRAF